MTNRVLIIDSSSVQAMRVKVLFELLGGEVEHVHYRSLEANLDFDKFDVVVIAHGVPASKLQALYQLRNHDKLVLLAPKPDNAEHLKSFSEINRALPNGIVIYPFFANKDITGLLERLLEIGSTNTLVLPKVLLVDHHTPRLETLANGLRGAQLAVTTATTLDEAMQAAERHPVDLLICDFNLEKDTGLDVFNKVRQVHHNCRCLLMTSRVNQVDMLEAVRQGVEDILIKPFDESDLLQSLHKLWQTELLRRHNQELVERLQDTVDALIERDSLLRVIYKHTPDPIMLFNRQGHIIEANDACCELFELTEEELQPLSIFELFDEISVSQLRDLMKHVGMLKHFNCELSLPKAGERSIPLMGTFNEIDHHGDMAFAVIFKNVSKLKEQQEVLEETKELLEFEVQARTAQLQKAKEAAEAANLSKSEFLANMSHELRTPMHSILSFARFGLDKLTAPEVPADKLKKYLSRIETSGERLLVLLNNLLDLSKLDAGRFPFNPSFHNLVNVIQSGIEDVSGTALEKKIKIRFEKPAQGVMTFCDPEQMNQVIRNLLGNALKFSPEGSEVSVLLSCKDQDIHIKIADQGVGIPDDELEQIFAKFVQSSKTDSGAGGTGLGLAICKEFILLHKGQIYAENNPEGGACINVSLPLTEHLESNAV
ncbi:hybrid sensor histidine kinase/response regulator [Pseudoalteromonas piscicida]|uniref:sensor histidine kinase n=1 Tax=Pseudoalteromonas piscicida TaxID=43662 RepID=UPI001D0A3E68|nr:hybrid sensor histidine kinase/response regulator [Pseudoalteromonas piscicida]UDM62692.1 hybrid sensor histidine kinase/response regulator [Pseudoalteromonas piscicida]